MQEMDADQTEGLTVTDGDVEVEVVIHDRDQAMTAAQDATAASADGAP